MVSPFWFFGKQMERHSVSADNWFCDSAFKSALEMCHRWEANNYSEDHRKYIRGPNFENDKSLTPTIFSLIRSALMLLLLTWLFVFQQLLLNINYIETMWLNSSSHLVQ